MDKDLKGNPFSYDDYRQQVPYFYYKRFEIDFNSANLGRSNIWSFALDYGYAYLLRRLSSQWPIKDDIATPQTELDISFFNMIRGSKYQDKPYPLRQVTTPGNPDINFSAAPAPVDQDGFGINFDAAGVKNRLVYNLFYQFRDAIHIEVNFRVQVPPVAAGKTYVDLMLDGYLIPEKNLAMWG